MHVVLAVDPVLAGWGQVAAIIICFYILVFVILAVAFNVAMAIAMGWVREKIEVVKLLRRTVDSVNETTQAVERGVTPDASKNVIIRTFASVPTQVSNVDEKVNQGADRVADVVIEARARVEQAKAIVKTFLLPGLVVREKRLPTETKSPDYGILMEQNAPEVPVEPVSTNGQVHTAIPRQLEHATHR